MELAHLPGVEMNWESIIVEKVRLLDVEKQRQVAEFIESLEQALPSYRALANLPVSQRHQYLAPLIQDTAEEFRANPELMELGLTVEQIAEKLRQPLDQVRKVSQQ